MALSKMQCYFITCEAGSWARFPKPHMSTGLPAEKVGSPTLAGDARRARVFSGCHSLVGPVGASWCPTPLDSNSASLVLEALGTSEHLFLGPDTGDTQGTVQLGRETPN